MGSSFVEKKNTSYVVKFSVVKEQDKSCDIEQLPLFGGRKYGTASKVKFTIVYYSTIFHLGVILSQTK